MKLVIVGKTGTVYNKIRATKECITISQVPKFRRYQNWADPCQRELILISPVANVKQGVPQVTCVSL